mgnify:CR=1 FL=1
MRQFSGKTAVVTGAASGMGRALTLKLLSLREEAKAHGVRVNAVCPGIVETNIVGADEMRRLKLDGDSPFDFIRRKSPVRPISAMQAADAIVAGVAKNQPEIIFPLHGKLAVSAFHNARRLWELAVAPGVKILRGQGG